MGISSWGTQPGGNEWGGRKGNLNKSSTGRVVGSAGARDEMYLCQEPFRAVEPGTWAKAGPGGSLPMGGHCDTPVDKHRAGGTLGAPPSQRPKGPGERGAREEPPQKLTQDSREQRPLSTPTWLHSLAHYPQEAPKRGSSGPRAGPQGSVQWIQDVCDRVSEDDLLPLRQLSHQATIRMHVVFALLDIGPGLLSMRGEKADFRIGLGPFHLYQIQLQRDRRHLPTGQQHGLTAGHSNSCSPRLTHQGKDS